MNKKIIVLITGQLRYFTELNYKILKNSLKNYDLIFYIACWEHETKDVKDKFVKLYNPIKLIEIQDKDFSFKIKKIKFPDTAVKSENIFKMWYSFTKGCEFLSKENFIEAPSYILRYRSDLLPLENQNIDIKFKDSKSILVPDLNHWNGINDQFFIFHYSKIKDMINLFEFIDKYLNKKHLFSSELIFQRFLKEKNFKIKYIDFDYKIMKKKMNIQSITNLKNKNNEIPFKERIFISMNKLKFKFRNFKKFYILKNKRNKFQDKIID